MNKFMPQGQVKEIKGSFTSPINAGLRLIVQLSGVNGKYDKPLDKAVAKIWKSAESDYKRWFALQQKFALGDIKEVAVASDIWVVHLLVRDKEDQLSETGLVKAMKKLAEFAKYERGSLHFDHTLLQEVPQLKDLIEKCVVPEGVHTYIYLPASDLLPAKK